MLAWSGTEDGLVRAFTDRSGGVSQGVYDGLNLGGHVGDDPERVRANRELVEQATGLRLVLADQVHGAEVLHVTDEVLRREPSPTGGVGTADAMVTDLPGLGLGVLVADCTPVLLHDLDVPLVGVAHAGRPGMLAGVVPALVAAMRDLGAGRLEATVGPSVCGRCYEVPAQMRDQAADAAPAAVAVSWTGTPAIDVAAGVVAQLTAAQVPLTWVPGCAREDRRWYSHRRDGVTGRFAGVVGRREDPRGGRAMSDDE